MKSKIKLTILIIISSLSYAEGSNDCTTSNIASELSQTGSLKAIAYTSSCSNGLQISLITTAQSNLPSQGNIATINKASANIKLSWSGDKTLHIQKDKFYKLINYVRSYNGVKINYDH